MNLVESQIFRYRLPLLEAFPRQKGALWAQGLIVVLHSKTGQVTYGEVTEAALASGETLEQAEKQIAAICCEESQEGCSAVQWAMSCAQFNLELASLGLDFSSWMNGTRTSEILLNTLIDASHADFVDKALSCHAQGFRVFKIKVGDDDLHREITRIREFLKIVGNNVVIRFDANRQLPLGHAVEIVRSLKSASIEYFEEPFEDLASIEEFYKLTNVRVALDETVVTPQFELWRKHEAVSTYVLKPARIGSMQRLVEIIKDAARLGRQFVISSTYESGIGLAALAQIASLKQNTSVAMGLATNAYFASDLLVPPLRAFRGHFQSDALVHATKRVDLRDSPFCTIVFQKDKAPSDPLSQLGLMERLS